MDNLFLYDFILKSAQVQLKAQKEDGSMPAGTNGPWVDIDTPVRNTAHWALLFYKAFEISGEISFLNATLSACDYLLSKKARPYNASFLCRLNEDKNKCNGLIGQVWAIEPLLFIGRELNRKDFLISSEQVLIKHKYDKKMHLWHSLEVNGKIGKIHKTFNQQLWFAVINLFVGRTTNNNTLLFRARDFLKYINRNILFLEDGLIRHEIIQGKDYCNTFRIQKLSLGYLTFNLFAFSLCYSQAPEEDFWGDERFKKIILQIISYILTDTFLKKTYLNEFAWSYNPCGFEVAFALHTFKELLNLKGPKVSIEPWVERQIEGHWDYTSELMIKNSTDSITLAARLYEATRLPNIQLKINNLSLSKSYLY